MTMVRESWLRSEDTDKSVEAAILCRNPSGTCWQDGHCKYGDCFHDIRQYSNAETQIERIATCFDELNRALSVLSIEQKVRFFRDNGNYLEVIKDRLDVLNGKRNFEYRRQHKKRKHSSNSVSEGAPTRT
jgi:hypothetical protein